MTKKEMAAFLVDVTKAAGFVDLYITGHSTRVTGAMRMAYAGHSLHTIKVFGRWGSSAVERYVREAVLGKKGGNLSKVTEGIIKELTGRAKNKKENKGKAAAVSRRRRLRRMADSEE